MFGRAFKIAQKDFWVSIQVLFWISLVLTVFFWIFEGLAQRDIYGGIRGLGMSFVWTITRYIGDPGHFAGDGPITYIGRSIDTIIGILKILIFAVPAGLVANGFVKAMNDDKRDRHLLHCRERIMASFRRQQTKKTLYRMVPRNVSIITLKAKKGMTEDDVIETVSRFNEFRLRNLATSQVASEYPQDRLVIEMLPLNDKTVDGFPIHQTGYGIKIDRGSNVTIVAPTAALENCIGAFSYYIAQFGGFNYVSREFVKDQDDPVSYYVIDNDYQDDNTDPRGIFLNDIKNLSKGKNSWIIFLISSDNHDTHFHYVHKANSKTGISQTTLDEQKLMVLYEELSVKMKDDYDFLSDMDEKYRPVGNKNASVRVGGGKENNCFTLRISYHITTWETNWGGIVLEMAKVFKKHLESEERKEFVENPQWKLQGVGFGENDK